MKHGGCRSSEYISIESVLHKGGYGSVHCTVHQQEAAYIHNRITVRFYRYDTVYMLRNITSPTARYFFDPIILGAKKVEGPHLSRDFVQGTILNP